LLGTDQVGRDTLSRVIYGARTSLFVAFSAVVLGTTVGSLWGVACGYLRGRFDLYSQRVMEILQSFPDLILAMAISMAIGTGLQAVIFAIAVTRIPFGGRVIRSVALSVREMPYVEAGRASGASALRVMTFHVLPQCVAPYLVLATTHLGAAIVIEAALGFLGVGVPPPTPTWGNMLADSITALVPPWCLASSASMICPVKIISAAFAMPTTRGRKYVPPQSGCRPRRTKACENRAALEARRMSQARARFIPAPTAAPFTAAMSGFGESRIRSTVRSRDGATRSMSGRPRPAWFASCIALTSPPAQKPLPAPVMTITRT